MVPHVAKEWSTHSTGGADAEAKGKRKRVRTRSPHVAESQQIKRKQER